MFSSMLIKLGDWVCAYSSLLNPHLQIASFAPLASVSTLLHLTFGPRCLTVPCRGLYQGANLPPGFLWALTKRKDQQEPGRNEETEVLLLLKTALDTTQLWRPLCCSVVTWGPFTASLIWSPYWLNSVYSFPDLWNSSLLYHRKFNCSSYL